MVVPGESGNPCTVSRSPSKHTENSLLHPPEVASVRGNLRPASGLSRPHTRSPAARKHDHESVLLPPQVHAVRLPY